jgi:hypothetical protein
VGFGSFSSWGDPGGERRQVSAAIIRAVTGQTWPAGVPIELCGVNLVSMDRTG